MGLLCLVSPSTSFKNNAMIKMISLRSMKILSMCDDYVHNLICFTVYMEI